MKWGIVFAILVVAWQVVGPLLALAEKRKKEASAQEAARQRQLREIGGARPEMQPGRPEPGVGGNLGRSKADALAERRRQQLQELRARREGRAGPGSAQIRTAPSAPAQRLPMPVAVPPSQKRSRTIETLEAGRAQLDRQRQAEIERREAHQRQLRRQQRLAQQRAEALQRAEERRLEQERRATAQASAAKAAAAVLTAAAIPELAEFDAYAAVVREAPIASPTALRAVLADRRSLRQLVLLREVLDPPLALRPAGEPAAEPF